MRLSLLPVVLIVPWLIPIDLSTQGKDLNPLALSEFLVRYSEGLKPLDAIYAEFKQEGLSVLDERGQPLARRPIEDRRRALDDLRKLVRELDSSPQDLVVAIHLLLQSKTIADDLFDLSRIAYDEDREDLGRRLAIQLSVMDHHDSLLESYALSLAAEREERIRTLENEILELRSKSRDAGQKPRAGVSRLPGVASPPRISF